LPLHPLSTALALALSAAVSLGMARFAYALLLPPMRADLGWSYLLAGAMNTANAAGYLLGALLLPAALRRVDARSLMLAGGAASALLLVLHGGVRQDAALLLLRAATGVASAAAFASGGVLAARLASQLPAGSRTTPGQVLGLYYGGTGLGIIVSTALAPPLPWPWAWVALGGACALATVVTTAGTRRLRAPPLAVIGRVDLGGDGLIRRARAQRRMARITIGRASGEQCPVQHPLNIHHAGADRCQFADDLAVVDLVACPVNEGGKARVYDAGEHRIFA